MKIELLATSHPSWLAVLQRCRHDCYHMPGWLRAAEFGDRGTAYGLYAREGEAELLLPLVRRELDGGHWDAVSPYGYGGPILSASASQHFADAALREAVDMLRAAGCVSWFIRLHPILNAEWHSAVGELVEQAPTVAIDLTRSEAEHWHDTTHGHRNDINKARRAGVTVRIDESFAALGDFVALYNQSMQRLQAPAYYYFDERYYQTLRAELGPSLRLFVAEESGTVIGAALLTVAPSSGILQGHLYGADERWLHRQPLKLLIHAQREWGRTQGYRVLNLGGGRGRGGEAEDSLFRFKRGFSPDTYMFRTQRLIVDAQRYAALCGG
ncbi:GNAT family N-acetyltransferase, partial [Cupriavidus necator]|uniref:GNAT family N-acetyltransferase n=1 Tax=Cupriavidus necator TaxID=106590 RepID=UPI00339D7ECE